VRSTLAGLKLYQPAKNKTDGRQWQIFWWRPDLDFLWMLDAWCLVLGASLPSLHSKKIA
jgi:hypothetical protein